MIYVYQDSMYGSWQLYTYMYMHCVYRDIVVLLFSLKGKVPYIVYYTRSLQCMCMV